MATPANKPTPKPTTTGKPATSGLMAKYGAKLDQAVRDHAGDETDYGFLRIPPGINNGIAQLRDCYFAQYKTGQYKDEYYCRMIGSVLSPESVNVQGQKVPSRGCITSQMFPCCDTKGKDSATGEEIIIPQSENIARILNEFRCLGGEDFTAGATGADLEKLAQELQKAKPYFKFTTSPKKDQKTGQYDYNLPPWENWQGSKGLENYSPPEGATVAVNDQSSIPGQQQPPMVNIDTTPQQSNNGTGVEYSDNEDLDSLLSRAKEDGPSAEQARTRLTEMAIAAGHSEDIIKATETWEEVVGLINSPIEGGEWKGPCVDEVYSYAPLDKSKKPGKPINCVVLMVDESAKTVTLRREDNERIVYKSVEWGQLQSAQ